MNLRELKMNAPKVEKLTTEQKQELTDAFVKIVDESLKDMEVIEKAVLFYVIRQFLEFSDGLPTEIKTQTFKILGKFATFLDDWTIKEALKNLNDKNIPTI